MEANETCRRYEIRGRVQGVAFRYFTRTEAEKLGVRGWVRNRPDGSVESVAMGSPEQLAAFERAVRTGPAGSRVDDVTVSESPAEPEGSKSFDIVF